MNKSSVSLVISFMLLALSACGNSTASNVEPSSNVTEPEEQVDRVGTNGQLISIESDNVRAAGYDLVPMVMTVQFDNGALYEYYGVSPDLWTSFIAAQPHPWSQVGYPRLVEGSIPYKRIE